MIEIVSSLEERKQNNLIIGTHNGIFHCDEVVACVILCLLYEDKSIQILRTRDKELLSQCDICVDIGGGEFDHHQKGFSLARENGILYASAGLVWKRFGRLLISVILKKHFSGYRCDSDIVFNNFDRSIISLVDCEDNGIPTEKYCLSYISSFLPLWFSDNFNEQFEKALEVTTIILEEELKTAISKEVARNTVLSNWNSNLFNNGILEIPSQTIDWLQTITEINEYIQHDKQINFVVFPYPNGGWAAQCVPPSMEDKFSQRIPFPAEWAGQTDGLPKISGIPSATFCHNFRFFARADNKKDIIKMCEIATDLF